MPLSLCCFLLPHSYTGTPLLQLRQPSAQFHLEDPYCRLLRTEYNCLHDPHLQAYYSRKDNLQRLKSKGFITSDGKVRLDVALTSTGLLWEKPMG